VRIGQGFANGTGTGRGLQSQGKGTQKGIEPAQLPVSHAQPPLLSSTMQQGHSLLPVFQPLLRRTRQEQFPRQFVIGHAHDGLIATAAGSSQSAPRVPGGAGLITEETIGTAEPKVIWTSKRGILEAIQLLLVLQEQLQAVFEAAQKGERLRQMQHNLKAATLSCLHWQLVDVS
jgi:hypothetical protein